MWKSLLVLIMLSVTPAGMAIDKRDIQLAKYLSRSDWNSIVPIATIRDGKLLKPVLYKGSSTNDITVRRFVRQHYSSGTQFHIWQSGSLVGQATITGILPGCELDYSFGAKPAKKFTIGAQHGALAISESLGKPHQSFDMLPTPEERASFAHFSQIALSKAYPAVTSKTKLHIHSLFVTRTAESGKPLLMGSISFTKNGREYWLFNIFERTGEVWIPAIIQIHRIRDLEDRKDAQQEEYLDQMDIDGDGVDEVFTISTYYEGFSFAAYGVRNGRWVQIYDSGYGGC